MQRPKPLGGVRKGGTSPEGAKEYSPWRKPWVAARNQAQPRRGERNGSLFAIGIRVQVKCTRFRRGYSYKCHLDSDGHPYSPNQHRLHRRLTSSRQTPGTSSPSAPRTHNPTSSRPRTTRVRSTKVQRSLIVGLEDSNW